jgi:hypothetical protein
MECDANGSIDLKVGKRNERWVVTMSRLSRRIGRSTCSVFLQKGEEGGIGGVSADITISTVTIQQ